MERIYGLDALRALTMYLGVILHSAIAYKAGYHPRYWVKDPEFSSFFFDELYFWIHSFRMPLFFLLSGFFTVLLCRKIGRSQFIKNRLRRIAVPLVCCFFFILPFSIAPFTFSRLYFDQGYSISEALQLVWQEIFRLITLREFKGFQHFWFLLNLLYFYSAYLIAISIGIKFDRIMKWIPARPWLVIGISTVITFFIMVLYRADLTPSIWTGFFPRNPQLLYYGFYYLIGVYIFYNNEWFAVCKKYAWSFLVIGTILSFVNVYIMNSLLADGAAYSTILFFKGLLAVQNVLLSFGTIGLCLRLFNSENPVIRYASDASYWVYIIHFVLVAGIQIVCIIYDVMPAMRFLITLSGTSLISYLSYHFIVRYTILGVYLHGKRKKISKGVLA